MVSSRATAHTPSLPIQPTLKPAVHLEATASRHMDLLMDSSLQPAVSQCCLIFFLFLVHRLNFKKKGLGHWSITMGYGISYEKHYQYNQCVCVTSKQSNKGKLLYKTVF